MKFYMNEQRMRVLIFGVLWLLVAIVLLLSVPVPGEKSSPLFVLFALVWTFSAMIGIGGSLFHAGKWLWENADMLANRWNARND